MILIIHEDGQKVVANELTEDLKSQWIDGWIDILSFINGKFVEWDGNKNDWTEVESV